MRDWSGCGCPLVVVAALLYFAKDNLLAHFQWLSLKADHFKGSIADWLRPGRQKMQIWADQISAMMGVTLGDAG